MRATEGDEGPEECLGSYASDHGASAYIVDDEPVGARAVASHLARAGQRTRVFRTPRSALSAFAAANCKPALLICKFSMPEMNGLELMRRCNQLWPGLKTVITGWTLEAEMLWGHRSESFRVLEKPLSLEALTAALEALAIPTSAEAARSQDDLRHTEAGGAPPARADAEARPLVYVVDNKINVAEMMAKALERPGFRALVFQSPAAAISALASASPKPTVLITDFSMPEMDGLELARRCQQFCPRLKVIVVSGTVSAKVLRGSSVDADAVLDKPVSLQHLTETVKSLCSSEPTRSNHGSDLQVSELSVGRILVSGPLVYVVDDEFVLAQLVSRRLLQCRYRTRAFASPLVALATLGSAGTKPALLITDLEMPRMNGVELARRCKEHCPALRVIVMTNSLPTDTTALAELQMRADAVLRKPFTPERLLYEVRTLINRAR